MSHDLPIAKLKAYNLSDSACQMVKRYLSIHYQRVKIGTHRSEWKRLEEGDPQGSTNGPDYFNIFKNNM